MKTIMSSNYKGDIFYTRDQVDQAIREACIFVVGDEKFP